VFIRRSQIPNFERQQFGGWGREGNTTIQDCITSVICKTWNRVQPRYNKTHKITENLILTNTCLSLLTSVPVSKKQKWTDWQLYWHTFTVVRLLWFEVVIALIIQSAGVWQHTVGRQAPALQWNLLPSSSFFYTEDTGSKFLWNVGAYLPSYMSSRSTRPTTCWINHS